MAIDLDNGYKEIKDKISSAKAYGDLKSQYDDLKKEPGILLITVKVWHKKV